MGNLLYFYSKRDGFMCIWAQRLDPASKRPSGAPFAVRHFHSARLAIPPVGSLGLAVAENKIVFTQRETAGNIWMARFERLP